MTMLFAVNTRLRPDEAWRLEFCDVTMVDDENLKTVLECAASAIAKACPVQ